MSWRRIAIAVFLVIIILNILQINLFLLMVYDSQPASNDLSAEMIPYIWYSEAAMGIIIALLVVLRVINPKKETRAAKYEALGQQVKGDIIISPTIGYNGASVFYKVTLNNRTAFPLSDVDVKSYLSQDIFEFENDRKSIPVVRPYDSETVKFKVTSRYGEPGDAEVLATVNYYNPGIDEYEERILKPIKMEISWPKLKELELDPKEWENQTGELQNAEGAYPDILLPGEKCNDYILDFAREMNLAQVSYELQEEKPYSAKSRHFARDQNDKKYAVELVVSSKGKSEGPSRLKINMFAENKEGLVGLYHFIIHEVTKGLRKVEKDVAMLQEAKKELAKARAPPPPVPSKTAVADGSMMDAYVEFDRLRNQIETIEKDKIGVDSKYKELYELDELYKILAEDLVKRKIVDIDAGEEMVKKKLDTKILEELKRFPEAYALLCEAETSDTVLSSDDFPNSGKKAILLVYFNAVEVYVREKLKELIPKGVTILLGENHGHINTRKKDWEKSWATLSLGSCIHIINHNGYLFLKNENLWKQRIETLMHQVREMRNIIAHPSKENPDPNLVREKVYKLLKLLPDVLKSK